MITKVTIIFYEGQYEDINVGVNDGINVGNNMDKVKLNLVEIKGA